MISPERARWAVASVFLVNGGMLGSWAPHVPLVKARLSLTDTDLGVALLVMAVGAAVAMPFSGFLIARLGSAPVTRWTIVLMSLTLPAVALAPTWELLLVAAFAFGTGMGLSDIGMNAHAVEVERRLARPVMSSLHGMFSVGGFLASALGGVALATATPGLHVAAAVATALGILALALPAMLPADADRAAPGTAFALPTPALVPIALLTFAVFMTEGAMIDWSAVYLTTAFLASPSLAAGGYAAFAAGMAVGRFAGDAIRRRTSAPLLVGAGATAAGLALVVAVAARDPLVAIAALGIAGLGLSNLVPVLFVAAGRTPGQPSATGVAAVATSGYFGLLAGPPLIGFVSDGFGMPAAFLMLAAACLVAAASARAAGRASPETAHATPMRPANGSSEIECTKPAK